MINKNIDWDKIKQEFQRPPFNHAVIDNFFTDEAADNLSNEFLSWDDPIWNHYNNQIEKKKTLNAYDRFQKNTYKAFYQLGHVSLIKSLKNISGFKNLYFDA